MRGGGQLLAYIITYNVLTVLTGILDALISYWHIHKGIIWEKTTPKNKSLFKNYVKLQSFGVAGLRMRITYQ